MCNWQRWWNFVQKRHVTRIDCGRVPGSVMSCLTVPDVFSSIQLLTDCIILFCSCLKFWFVYVSVLQVEKKSAVFWGNWSWRVQHAEDIVSKRKESLKNIETFVRIWDYEIERHHIVKDVQDINEEKRIWKKEENFLIFVFNSPSSVFIKCLAFFFDPRTSTPNWFNCFETSLHEFPETNNKRPFARI
jgi:hypothetical protein